MTKSAVLINGVPASGKSTVARLVAARRGWPLLGLDTIKEPFFAHLGTGDRAYNRLLGGASYQAIFELIASFPDPMVTVIDAWFGFQPLEVLLDHLGRAGIGTAVEIWCSAPPETITARYAERIAARGPGHPGADYLPELAALAASARPFGRFPCLKIETHRPLDQDALLDWLDRTLTQG